MSNYIGKRGGISLFKRKSITKRCGFLRILIQCLVVWQCIVLLLLFFGHGKFSDLSNNMQMLNEAAFDFNIWFDSFLAVNSSAVVNDLIALENSLVQKAEDFLDMSIDHEEEKEMFKLPKSPEKQSIDDYYKRKHFSSLSRNKHSDTHTEIKTDPVILIIGGLQGSGTRVFVETLRRLGVPMFIDDRETLGLHVKTAFRNKEGWKYLASTVLDHTKSINYELSNFPPAIQGELLEETKSLQRTLEKKYEQFQNQNENMNANKNLATNVKFGFKAPETIILLPLLHEILKPIKFIHVVRDGRDVSLLGNGNNEALLEYYDNYYSKTNGSNSTASEALQKMHLWNDWNIESFNWQRSRSTTASSQLTLDYLTARIEDLLDPQTKFHSLVQLAHFVGSPKSYKQLCCLSRKPLVESESAANDAFQKYYLKALAMGKQVDDKNKQNSPNESALAKQASQEERMKQILKLRESHNEEHKNLRMNRIKEVGERLEQRNFKSTKNQELMRKPQFHSILKEYKVKQQQRDQEWQPELRQVTRRRLQQLVRQKKESYHFDDVDAIHMKRRGQLDNEKSNYATRRQQQLIIPDDTGRHRSSGQDSAGMIDNELFMKEFSQWRQQFMEIKNDPQATKRLLSIGENLYDRYKHEGYKDSLKGILGDHSFVRSLNWLRSSISINDRKIAPGDFSGLDNSNSNSDKEEYGLWASKLQNRPDIVSELSLAGGNALQMFGYNVGEGDERHSSSTLRNQKQFLDTNNPAIEINNFQCNGMVICED